eukprot:1372749-Pyramimonas_sp.AAC.1
MMRMCDHRRPHPAERGLLRLRCLGPKQAQARQRLRHLLLRGQQLQLQRGVLRGQHEGAPVVAVSPVKLG